MSKTPYCYFGAAKEWDDENTKLRARVAELEAEVGRWQEMVGDERLETRTAQRERDTMRRELAEKTAEIEELIYERHLIVEWSMENPPEIKDLNAILRGEDENQRKM